MEFAELIQKAKEAKEQAYAPYSGFHVERHCGAKTVRYLPDAISKIQRMVLQTVQNVPQYSKRFRKDFVNLKQSLLSVTANSRQRPAVSAAR